MVVELSAAVCAAYYAANVPVKVAFRFRLAGGNADMATGVSVFEGRFALRAAGQRMGGLRKRRKWDSPGVALRQIPALIRAVGALKYALEGVRLDSLSVRGTLGFSDAMTTALAAGGLSAAGRWARNASGGRIRLRVQPDFASARVALDACGIVSVRAGHIILAALAGALEYANGRLSQWIHTRLKTS